MNTDKNASDYSHLPVHHHRTALAVAASLEFGVPSMGTSWSLTYTFASDHQAQAARDAWRAHVLAAIDVPPTLAATAAQRLTAEISMALFGDATLDLIEIANRLKLACVAAAPPPLVSPSSI